VARDEAAFVSSIPPEDQAEKSCGERADCGQGENESSACLDGLTPPEKPDALDHESKQDERDREVNYERMEAADELAEVAALNTVRWSVQGGQQQNQNDKQADTTQDEPGAGVHPGELRHDASV
jgi:hypothetical protein